MRDILALISYGLLLLGGYLTCIYWSVIAWQRFKELRQDIHLIRRDKYALLTGCLGITSLGTSIFFTGRAWKFTIEGLSTVHTSTPSSYALLIGLYVMSIGYAGFVWALYCTHRAWIWRMYLVLALLWIVLALGWVWVDPFHNYPYK